jgi:hypothetical protein
MCIDAKKVGAGPNQGDDPGLDGFGRRRFRHLTAFGLNGGERVQVVSLTAMGVGFGFGRSIFSELWPPMMHGLFSRNFSRSTFSQNNFRSLHCCSKRLLFATESLL